MIGDIINKELSKNYLNNDIFKQIKDAPEISFISATSKGYISKYISSKTFDLSISKSLWKNLLMDAICILKVNDFREKIYKDSKSDIQRFKESFDSIRSTNTYGINEIENYINDFVEFETVLYGTDEHYRDHIEHVIQVWALGIGLLEKHKFTIGDNYSIANNDYHFEIEQDNNHTQISKSELWSMWTIIALCHDLGYPIEKTSKINKQAKKIISHFGNMNFSELNYSFDIFNTFLVDKYLNVISSKTNNKEKTTYIQTKYRDKFAKSLEEYKHGAFSGLLLFKNLTYFLETDYFSGTELSIEDLRQFVIRKEILRAITCHTCPKIYHLSLNTLSFLLILCDEIQEWNRPKFDDLRSGSIKIEPQVEISKFDISDENQSIKIKFEYKIDANEGEEKHLVIRKFKHVNNLLRGAKDDKNRKINFEWEIIFNNKVFVFNFNSNENSFDQLRTTKKDTRIPKQDAIPFDMYNYDKA